MAGQFHSRQILARAVLGRHTLRHRANGTRIGTRQVLQGQRDGGRAGVGRLDEVAPATARIGHRQHERVVHRSTVLGVAVGTGGGVGAVGVKTVLAQIQRSVLWRNQNRVAEFLPLGVGGPQIPQELSVAPLLHRTDGRRLVEQGSPHQQQCPREPLGETAQPARHRVEESRHRVVDRRQHRRNHSRRTYCGRSSGRRCCRRHRAGSQRLELRHDRTERPRRERRHCLIDPDNTGRNFSATLSARDGHGRRDRRRGDRYGISPRSDHID